MRWHIQFPHDLIQLFRFQRLSTNIIHFMPNKKTPISLRKVHKWCWIQFSHIHPISVNNIHNSPNPKFQALFWNQFPLRSRDCCEETCGLVGFHRLPVDGSSASRAGNTWPPFEQWLKPLWHFPWKSKDYFLNGFSVKTIVFVGIYNQQFKGTILFMVFDFQGFIILVC